MIDVHSHILPGIDDGSKDIEMSLQMLKRISEESVDTVFLTPHFYADMNDPVSFLNNRQASFKKLVEAITTTDAPCPRLVLGSEVHYYRGIGRSEHIDKLCLGRSRFLLLEPTFREWTPTFVDEVRALSYNGDLKVIIAHIERYLDQDRDLISDLLHDRGILIQSNAEFFIDKKTRRKALKMFGEGFIDLLGSDCHNLTTRPPDLDEAIGIIKGKFGESALDHVEELGSVILDEALNG